jgi:regulator of protease activity HflC (stomatin/prohibitin superfamily)
MEIRWIKLGAAALLGVFIIIYAMSGMTHVSPGEVGILMKNIGSNTGMQKDVLSAGTHWVDAFTYDVDIYDTRLKQYPLEDTGASTADGQPILVDVSLEIGLVDRMVPTLHSRVGVNWFEQVVKPSAISALREATAGIMSDNVYTGTGRALVRANAEKVLKEKYELLGINIDFNVKDISFSNKQFVAVLEQKAKASQQQVIEERLALAAVEEAKKMSNLAEGKKQERIRAAEANSEEMRLAGEGTRKQKEEEAKGILAVARAEAEGVRLRREALSGAGGSELVSIEWAKNLGPNVKVYGFPTGAPGTNSFMGLNGLFEDALRGAKQR